MNLSIKYWDKGSIFSSENLNILHTVLPIITLSWSINKVLGPYKNCISSWGTLYLNFLSSATFNPKFILIGIFLKIEYIHVSCYLLICQSFGILPSRKVNRTQVRGNIWILRYKLKSIKLKLGLNNMERLINLIRLSVFKKLLCCYNFVLRCLKIWRMKNINLVPLCKSCHKLLTFVELKTLRSFFWCLFPFKLCLLFSTFHVPYY